MANLITISRFPLLFIYIGILYYGSPRLQFWNVPFILGIIMLDSVDGLVARRRRETSLLGSALDIATDRTLEYLLWVVFAHLNLVPVVVPLIVLTRGTTVDAVRSLGIRQGISAFEQIQMPISRFLVSSRLMRAAYGTAKAAAFALLTLALAAQNAGQTALNWALTLALGFTWVSVLLCLMRGLPVLLEGFSRVNVRVVGSE